MRTYILLIGLMLVGLFPEWGCAEVVSVQIIDFRDDAEEEITGPNAGNVFRSSSDLEFGNQNGVEQWVGLRFQNLAIPNGAIINSASIRLTATTTDVGTLVIPVVGELSPDTVDFSDLTPLTNRPLTTAQLLWNVDPWFPGDSGPNTTTPDLAAIVQEIVGQGGWSSGNSMVFLFMNDALDSSERIAVSFDGNPAMSAVLTIDYTPQPVVPLARKLLDGVVSSGVLSDIAASDNVYLAIDPSPTGNPQKQKIDMILLSQTNVSSPTSFTFRVEAAMAGGPSGDVIQTIELWNKQDNVWEVAHSQAATITDSVAEVTATGDLSRFVHPTNGEILARLRWQSPSFAGSTFNWSIDVDEAVWSIE